jgi:hypothetical protein
MFYFLHCHFNELPHLSIERPIFSIGRRFAQNQKSIARAILFLKKIFQSCPWYFSPPAAAGAGEGNHSFTNFPVADMPLAAERRR